jgi:hypothetical protein
MMHVPSAGAEQRATELLSDDATIALWNWKGNSVIRRNTRDGHERS